MLPLCTHMLTAAGVRPMTETDRRQILSLCNQMSEQALRVLVDNSIKYSPEGGRILLRVWRQGRMLYVTVADNGKGMTEEELAALSEKMRQSEQTGKSIGLGNIFRRVSMLYPDTGKMQVFSRAGHGTVIRFEIPQGEEEERA